MGVIMSSSSLSSLSRLSLGFLPEEVILAPKEDTELPAVLDE
jgi:hypothetical protein